MCRDVLCWYFWFRLSFDVATSVPVCLRECALPSGADGCICCSTHPANVLIDVSAIGLFLPPNSQPQETQLMRFRSASRTKSRRSTRTMRSIKSSSAHNWVRCIGSFFPWFFVWPNPGLLSFLDPAFPWYLSFQYIISTTKTARDSCSRLSPRPVRKLSKSTAICSVSSKHELQQAG